jgi:hypothetical protein
MGVQWKGRAGRAGFLLLFSGAARFVVAELR